MNVRLFAAAVSLATALASTGCSTLSAARKVDYRDAQTHASLEVPPGLAGLPDKNTTDAGHHAATATYSGYEHGQSGQAAQTSTAATAEKVLPQSANVKVVHEGQMRYIVVNETPGVVWGQVRDFITRAGLSIASQNPKAGLLETGWAETHALVGASKGNALAKWLKSLYSTGVRNKYRVRLERGDAPDTTEIYLSHESMEQVALDPSAGAQYGWRPRQSDPEVQAEMLQRLAAYLKTLGPPAIAAAKPSPAPAAQTAAPPPTPSSAYLTHGHNGVALLTLQDSLDRAWRRVGLSLDRVGFTVEDRDRSKGIYYVRYIDPDTRAKEGGFFSRLFGGHKQKPNNQYQVRVKPADNGTDVEVLDKKGDPEASKTGERILSLLYEQLK